MTFFAIGVQNQPAATIRSLCPAEHLRQRFADESVSLEASIVVRVTSEQNVTQP